MVTKSQKTAAKTTPKTAANKAAKKASARKPLLQAKKAGGSPLRGLVAAETLDTLAQLKLVKTDLEKTSEKLNSIDPGQLDDGLREQWSHEMDRVDLAIARARNALLSGLVQAFELEVPVIQTATSELAKSLERLNNAKQVIEAVSGVLGVIEKVITLGR